MSCADRFMAGGEHVIIWQGGSYYDALVWEYERGGSYVPCSHLRVVASREVRRVGLRAGRFVEAGLRADKFVEAYIS